MNPWWIYFWSKIVSRIPTKYCPSCGLPLNPSRDINDPEHTLCNHCFKELNQDELPKGKKKGS